MSSLRFGVSTHLYHDQRLDREHLVEIAAHGFECVELFATRSHFDYHDSVAVRSLAEWLDDTRLDVELGSCADLRQFRPDGAWGEAFSNAIADETQRRRTLAEAEAALAVSQTIPFRHLVVHLGVPDAVGHGLVGQQPRGSAQKHRGAASRSAERGRRAAGLGGHPQPAVDARNALVSFIENDLEGARVGICMDVGHAHLMGDSATPSRPVPATW